MVLSVYGDGPKGGAIACLDADKAYDRVEIPVLLDTLRAFGFPEEFIDLTRTLYTGLHLWYSL